MPSGEELGLALGREADALDRGRVAAPASVSASGRKRSPAATARLTSVECIPAQAGSPSQSGSSIHSPTSCSLRNSSETHVTSAPASSSPQATPSPVAL